MRRFIFFLTASTVGFSLASAQPFHLQLHPSITILRNGNALLNPFCGGINRPIHQFVDIDGDGDVDLFILDTDGHLSFYRNRGSSTAPQFRHEAASFQNLAVGSWFRFVDIDDDGDYDLFANGPASTVRLYRNVGTKTAPQFVLEIPILRDVNNNAVLSEEISIPAFADPDGDGDFDFFSGNSAGTIWYYENIGSPMQFAFRFVTSKYQNIEIIGPGGRIALPSPHVPLAKFQRHGAMAIDFADIDGNGTLDLFWGDLFNRSLYFLENRGTPTAPQFVLTDSTYPKPNPVFTDGFNMPQLVDIDSDGDLDLFIGVLFGTATSDNFHFYRNIGMPQAPQFVRETTQFVSTLDVGAASSPVFVDLDGDGDLDLVIGSEDGKLVLYERTGPAALEHKTDRLIDLSGLFNVSPAFGDIDGDGKPDLLLGDANGRLRLYRGPVFSAEDTTFPLRGVVFGQNAAPALADIAGRGLLDLFVGTGGGRIHHYRNVGTTTQPNFVFETNAFASIHAGDDAKPTFVDFDGDGRLDLVVGSRDSSVMFFRNDGGLPPAFVRAPNAFAGQILFARTAPAFADLDGDGDPDMLLGNYKGGLYFYRNERIATAVPASSPASFWLGQNYPNPFSAGGGSAFGGNPSTTIEFEVPETDAGFVSIALEVYNTMGQRIRTLAQGSYEAGRHRVVWDGSDSDGKRVASGVYYYRLAAGDDVETRRMLLLR